MKNGFTLVELLAILVILGIITIVAVPSVITTNQKANENDYNEFKKTVENAAEVYIETHLEQKPTKDGMTTVSINNLIEVGLLNGNLINPKTNKTIDSEKNNATSFVTVENKNGTITYTYNP